MRNDLNLTPWTVSARGSAWKDDFFESIFFLGNGRLGVRGYLHNVPHRRGSLSRAFSARSSPALRTLSIFPRRSSNGSSSTAAKRNSPPISSEFWTYAKPH